MIIAEACTNWDNLTMAKEMIKTSKENGASLAKFQLFDAEEDRGKPHYDWVKAHELTFDQAKELFDYGQSIGQEVFFSVFNLKYIGWCFRMGVQHIKLAADISTDERYFKRIGHMMPIIASTRMKLPPSPNHTEPVMHPKEDYLVQWLYCPPGYPQKPNYLLHYFGYHSGFSDHTIGLDVAKIALARGAQIIEKHFVLEHDSRFPDDAWSMTPAELKELVRWEAVCRSVLG